jgi:hypothetical protein
MIAYWYAQFHSLKVTDEIQALNLIYYLQNDVVVQQIKMTIIKYWKETIQPLLDPFTEKYSNYVIDIGLIENKLTNKYDCIVIEMNPFETTTNPSLFDWKTDYNQLRGQGYQIEIHVRSDYYPDIEDYIQFLLEVNQCNEEYNSSSDQNDKKHNFIFLDQIKTQLSS